MQTTPDKEQKRLILLHPEKSFLKQFSKIFPFKKIVLTRKKDPHVFALNEWPSYKFLKYLLFIPFVIIIFSFTILLVIVLLPVALFNKKFVEEFMDKFPDKLENIAVRENEDLINNSIRAFAFFFNNPAEDAPIRRILCLHDSDKKIILKINIKKAYQYIDEIWVYDNIEEIYDKCLRSDYFLEHSYIALNKETEILNNLSKSNFVNIEWMNSQNENIIQAVKRREDWNYKVAEMLKPKAPRIKLKPNNILTHDIVYYHETEFHPEINSYLLENYDRINKTLESKGMHFLYLPKLLQEIELADETIFPFVEYLFPDLFKGSFKSKQELTNTIFQNIDSTVFSKSIQLALEIPDQPHPCFLHSIDLPESLNEYKTFKYSVCHLDNIFELGKKVDFYLYNVQIAANNVSYRLVDVDPEDPDDVFHRNKDHVENELKKVISSIKSYKSEKLIIGSLVYIIKNLKDSQPELCENLNKVLYDTIQISNQPLSRLLIDEKFRIFLLDYDNLEIELTPLPKTLFIFLLKHPEGIKLKELYEHRSELIEIYGQIGNRMDMEQITKSIQDLTDVRTNSINEKCSRIKEAFISKIDESIAQNYFITGSRSENKGITLDRSLVIFSERK